jgi:hypothetical protein
MTRSALAAAARRFGILLGAIAAATAAVSLVLGLAAGAGVNRSISLGFYVVGSFLLIAGFFVGNRGPARLRGEEHGGLLGPRRLRWASLEERTSALNESALLVAIGFVLLVVGLLVDDRARVF